LPKERSAANALQVLIKQIDDHAKQRILINRKGLIEDFKEIMQALGRCVSKVEVKARTLAVPLLNGLKEEVERLLVDLTALERNLETLQSRFLDKEQTYVRETGALTVNGILLYDFKDIDQVYQKPSKTNRRSSARRSLSRY
jgi:pyruvate-formate lyase-activating enzyme